jgi:hypothetical protein
VFNIQKFDSNREKLWRNMRAILFFREAFQQLNSRHFRLFLRPLLIALLTSPMFVLKWIFTRVTMSLKNFLR